MFLLTVEETFAAAHFLPDYDGPCSRMHGHTWRVEATFAYPFVQEEGPKKGMAEDFALLKDELRKVRENLDHQCLNEIGAFQDRPPTAEMIAYSIYKWLAAASWTQSIYSVQVWESDRASACYRPAWQA